VVRAIRLLIDDLLHILVLVDVFPPIVVFLRLGWIGWREIVIVRDLELVDLGIVGDLAVALVDHVFADGLQGVELPAFAVAVYADVADGDLFCEVVDEAGDVDEIVGIGDEEGVGGGHVGEIVLEGGERGGAEETRGGRGLLWRGRGLGRASGGAVSVPFRVEVGSVGVARGICLSAGGGYGGGGGGESVPARIAPGCGRGGVLRRAVGELVGEEGGGDGGQAGDPALDVVAVEVGAVVCACGGSAGRRRGGVTHAGRRPRRGRGRRRDR
jgi:hypothetical protein